MIGRSRLDPHTLPDTTAGPVEDVRRVQGLFADGNYVVIAVSWVMYEDEAGDLSAYGSSQKESVQSHLQLVRAIRRQVVGHIHSEMEVASTIETCILAVDVHPRLVVDSTEIEMCSSTSPVRRDIE